MAEEHEHTEGLCWNHWLKLTHELVDVAEFSCLLNESAFYTTVDTWQEDDSTLTCAIRLSEREDSKDPDGHGITLFVNKARAMLTGDRASLDWLHQLKGWEAYEKDDGDEEPAGTLREFLHETFDAYGLTLQVVDTDNEEVKAKIEQAIFGDEPAWAQAMSQKVLH
jgi:hypothetical protein